MKDNNQILEIYVDFIAGSMNDLERLCSREKELLQRMNLINRKRNIQLLHHEYLQYLDKLSNTWSNIYNGANHYSDTVNKTSILESRQSLYAVTLPQKCVEQFFYHLHLAIKVQATCFEDEQKYKMYYSDFFSSIGFSSVKVVMRYLLPIALEAMKSNDISINEYKKQTFIVENRRYLPDLSINYHIGEELSDSRIDRILADLEEQKKKKAAAFRPPAF